MIEPAQPAPPPQDPVRVSVLLLAYQQQRYAAASTAACLALEGGPYEIIFSDDGSTDGTFETLQAAAAAYRGPHRVRVRRNERNLGIGLHYNALVAESTGELLLTAAADDLSLPDRVLRTVAAWEAHDRRPDLIAGHLLDLTDDGQLHGELRVDDLAQWQGPQDWARQRPYVVGAAHAFTRRLWDRFGPFDPDLFYEDQILTFRAIVSGGAITVDAPLVQYRRGGTSARPQFESVEQQRAWTARQLRRHLAEMRRLTADAELAGCREIVEAHLARESRRKTYHLAVIEARNHAERWALARSASDLPLWWRSRKVLHEVWPEFSFRLRRGGRAPRRKA